MVAVVLTLWDRFVAALIEPAGTSTVPVAITVGPNETLTDVLPRLVDKGLIRNPDLVRRYLARFHDTRPLTPGEYALNPSMGPAEQVAHLESGRRVARSVDIPEGATLERVAALLGEAGIVEPEVFLRLARQPQKIWPDAQVPNAEGFLQPDVYTFGGSTPPQRVLTTMLTSFRRAFERNVGDAHKGLTRTEVVVLASLIERARIPRGERRLYSAMMRNRLRAKRRLRSEAARRYAEGLPVDEQPAWDTFSQPGLPPSPICSPGVSALRAAADPVPSRAMFQVARRDGSHVYCEDLECVYDESARYGQRLPPGVSPRPAPPPPPPQNPAASDDPVEPNDSDDGVERAPPAIAEPAPSDAEPPPLAAPPRADEDADPVPEEDLVPEEGPVPEEDLDPELFDDEAPVAQPARPKPKVEPKPDTAEPTPKKAEPLPKDAPAPKKLPPNRPPPAEAPPDDELPEEEPLIP